MTILSTVPQVPSVRHQLTGRPTVRALSPRHSFVIAPRRNGGLLLGDDSALPAIAHQPDRPPAGEFVTVLPNAPNADNRPKPASGADLQLRWVGDQADPTSSLRVGEAAAIAQLRHKRLGDKCHDRQPMRAAASRKHSTTTHQNNLEN